MRELSGHPNRWLYVCSTWLMISPCICIHKVRDKNVYGYQVHKARKQHLKIDCMSHFICYKPCDLVYCLIIISLHYIMHENGLYYSFVRPWDDLYIVFCSETEHRMQATCNIQVEWLICQHTGQWLSHINPVTTICYFILFVHSLSTTYVPLFDWRVLRSHVCVCSVCLSARFMYIHNAKNGPISHKIWK